MLYKPDARKLWKVFHFVCFHFPLFKHFFVFFFIFSRQSKSKRNFTRNIRLSSEITFGAERNSDAWKVNKHFEMLSSLLDATSFGEDESEIIDAVTPKTVKFLRSFRYRCTFFPCTTYERCTRDGDFYEKSAELLSEWKICFHSGGSRVKWWWLLRESLLEGTSNKSGIRQNRKLGKSK